jgi:hypothetical protein
MSLGTEPGAFDVFVGGDSTTTNAAHFVLDASPAPAPRADRPAERASSRG